MVIESDLKALSCRRNQSNLYHKKPPKFSQAESLLATYKAEQERLEFEKDEAVAQLQNVVEKAEAMEASNKELKLRLDEEKRLVGADGMGTGMVGGGVEGDVKWLRIKRRWKPVIRRSGCYWRKKN